MGGVIGGLFAYYYSIKKPIPYPSLNHQDESLYQQFKNETDEDYKFNLSLKILMRNPYYQDVLSYFILNLNTPQQVFLAKHNKKLKKNLKAALSQCIFNFIQERDYDQAVLAIDRGENLFKRSQLMKKLGPQQIIKIGDYLFDKGDYQLASQVYRDFLQEFPRSPHIKNIQQSIQNIESYFSEKNMTPNFID